MIPLAIPNTGSLEGEYLKRCIDENFVSTVGAFVTRFEEEVAALSGSPAGAAMGSGTQGLHLALKVLDVRSGDLVITPSFTFIATANAISHSGATPWFIDIDSTNWTMDPVRVAEEIEAHAVKRNGALYHLATGRRIAALMPVYTLGTPADMDGLVKVAQQYNLPIVADAAAAIGVRYRERPIGEIADLTVYSFNGNKTITSGGGGMIVGREDLVKRAKHLSSTARVSLDYEHDEVGYNYRMTNLEAAVGCAQLQRLGTFLDAKKRIRAAYDRAFANHEAVAPFPAPSDGESTFWLSGVVLSENQSVKDACTALWASGIEARPFWKPVHLQAPYRGSPCGTMAVTNSIWHRILTLPCSTSLSKDNQALVVSALLQHLES